MNLLHLFWIFLKINFLSTSGPASVGLTHKELVETGFLSEEEFMRIIALSSSLPGSDAMQNALMCGFTLAGLVGAIIAGIAAILPILIGLLIIMIFLHFVGNPEWMPHFMNGLKPALAVLLIITAVQILDGRKEWATNAVVLTAVVGLIAFILMYFFDIPIGLVLILSGIIGVLIKL